MPTSIAPDDKTLCDRKDITHVVTGLEYGMSAVFDFKKNLKSTENKEEIEGKLAVEISSIPGMKIEGEVQVISVINFLNYLL